MVKLSNKFWLVGLAGLIHLFIPGSTLAQSIEADNTLAPVISNVTFSPGNNTFEITGGQVSDDRNSLLHSFSEFSVPLGNTAFFNHDASIQNIIGRVTGDSVSVIDGSIRAGGTADLFLLNPNGIIFGPEAKLEINGSFLATTADRILFEGGEFFSATETENQPLLTVGVPTGLQFGQMPGSIVNRSVSEGVGLQVPRRETLALVGSDVVFEQGGANAQYGRIEVGSVAANSLVGITLAPEGWALGYEAVENFRDIELYQATISTNGPLSANPTDLFVPSSGDIQLQGQDIIVADRSRIVLPRFIISDSVGDLIVIASDSVEISDDSVLSTNVIIGTAGDIFIETERLVIRDLGAIGGSTLSGSEFRAGGNITIRAQESVELQDGFITTNTSASQDAGNIDIQTARLILREGGQINTFTEGSGNAGVLNIDATESVLISDTVGINPSGLFTRTSDTGDAGRVSVETGQLTIQDGGRISVAAEPDETGGLVPGDAGSALIQAGQISLQDNGQITAANVSSTSEGIQLQGVDSLSVSGGSQITASTQTGEAGSVLVNADEAAADVVLVSGEGSRIAAQATEAGGTAGSVAINATQLTVEAGAEVTVSSPQGQAGNLDATAEQIRLDNGTLAAEAGAGQGAVITLQGLELLLLSNNGQISAQAFQDADGGNVVINAADGFIVAVLDQDNDIIANAVEGQGGDIDITVQNIFGLEVRSANNGTNDIDASSEAGIDGEITIDRLGVDPNQGINELPTGLAVPDISQGCQASDDVNSRFINTGRGGLTTSPYEPLSSDGIQEDIYPAGQAQSLRPASEISPETLLEAQNWGRNPEGEVVLMAASPEVQSFCQGPLLGAF